MQPIFSQGMIYAPARDWAEQVIIEMSMFPAGRFSDLTDSSSQGLKYLGDVGLAQSDEEQHEVVSDLRGDWPKRDAAQLHKPDLPEVPLWPGQPDYSRH